MKTVRATVITDASFCHHTRSGGWAAWVTINTFYELGAPRVIRIKRYGTFHKRPKNSTEAEVWAAYNGIWLAYANGATDILIQTDCTGAIDRDHKGAAKKHWPDATVAWRHVKGHTDREEARFFVNRWCDEHAGKMMRKQRRRSKRG